MEWVVKTVQEVTDLPLSLDTTNPLAMEAGLKAHKGKALLNSISLERMAEELPLAVKYDCDSWDCCGAETACRATSMNAARSPPNCFIMPTKKVSATTVFVRPDRHTGGQYPIQSR